MDPMMQAQAQAWTVGGAVIGTLIGVAIGLTWFALTRKKPKKEADQSVRQEVEGKVKPQVAMQPPVRHEGPIHIRLIDQENPSNSLEGVVEDQLILGRNPERAQIVVSDHTVSGAHCKFYHTNGELFLVDLASTNGTYVNGVRVDKIMPLSNKDQLKIGQKNYEMNY